MNDDTFRRELIAKLDRIATALELANTADPLLAIQEALQSGAPTVNDAFVEARRQGAPGVTVEDIARNLEAHRERTNADMPPAQRRAMGLD